MENFHRFYIVREKLTPCSSPFWSNTTVVLQLVVMKIQSCCDGMIALQKDDEKVFTWFGKMAEQKCKSCSLIVLETNALLS